MLLPIAILCLLAFSALFSACETAFSSVNKIRLKHSAMQGDKKAEKALNIAESFDRALTAILIGNNLVNIFSASLGTILFNAWFGEGSVGIASLCMTVLVLIFGEIIPKSYAKSHAEPLTRFFAAPLHGLIWILTPVIFLFNQLSKLVQSKDAEPSVTEDELKVIVEQIEEEGVLEEQESDLVRSALEFDEISVNEVLVPRVNIVAVQKDMPIDEVKQVFLRERYSRLPVYDETLDDIIGFITEKDFFGLIEEGGTALRPIIKNIIRLPEFARISDILGTMQRAKSHIALVMDQYGGTKGMVTLEDIIEELVGEIYDEADEVIPLITKLDANSYDISGEYSIGDLCDALDLNEDAIETDCTTLGGWAMELFGHIPAVGESYTGEWFALRVTAATDQKIERIRFALRTPEHSDAAK